MKNNPRVLVTGLDPEVVDFSRVPVPGLTKEILVAQLAAEHTRLAALGYRVRMLYLDAGETAEAVLRQALTEERYDCIMIGAGVRLPPHHFLLFEKLVNVVHRHAPPATRICFNTRPDDTVEAVQRWL
jgi:hypothetical protein